MKPNKLLITAVAASMASVFAPMSIQASEIIVGYSADALTLDPGNHRNRETETIIRNMYDGILTRNSSMEILPEIAESYKQIDELTYEFKIRSGIKFHDGSELSVEDIKFTLDRLTKEGALGGQTSPRQSLLGTFESAEVVDANTLHIKLKSSWPILPAMLPFQEVVSKAFVEKVGDDGMATQANGTGPFKLVEWRKGEAVILERFDDYYGGAAGIEPVGKACVDNVIFKAIPENASRVAALLAGEVHIIDMLPPHNIAQVENNPNTKVLKVNGTRTSYIALNNQVKPFNDVRVRQALAHALDRQLIIDKVLFGNATITNGILSPDAFGKNHNLPGYAHDPAKAKALLAEAGYPDGLEVTLDTVGSTKELAEAVAAVANDSGFTIKVSVGENQTLISNYRTKGEPITGQMWLTSWGNGSLDPFGIFVPTHRTNDRGNSSGYSNPTLDALLDAAGTEIDREKRSAMYQEAEALAASEAPFIYLWVAKDVYGVSTRLKNWVPSPDSRINLHDACID